MFRRALASSPSSALSKPTPLAQPRPPATVAGGGNRPRVDDSLAHRLARVLFPTASSSSSSASSGRDESASLLGDALRRRRVGQLPGLFSFRRSEFAVNALLQHCPLQLVASGSVAEWCAVDPALADELILLLLAPEASAATTQMAAAAASASPHDLSPLSALSSPASALSVPALLDVDAASVVALPSRELRAVIEHVTAIAGHRPASTLDDPSSSDAAAFDTQFVRVLTNTVVESNDVDDNDVFAASSASALPSLPRAADWMVPERLFPTLLAYSTPSACVQLIERDAAARLKLVSSPATESGSDSTATGADGPLAPPPPQQQQPAPIDPVLFLRLFSALLRNPSLSRESRFVAGHRALLCLLQSYSVQQPDARRLAESLLLGFDASSSSSSSSRAATMTTADSELGAPSVRGGSLLLKNVVTVLVVRAARLYGRTARALEFGELHRALCEGSAAWMVQLAPTLYWTWLLGATLDAARSTTGSSDGGLARLLPAFITPRDARARDLDIEALARLWAAFLPQMEQAVAVAARLSDEACRKVRTTCIRVAVLLDEGDDIVGQSHHQHPQRGAAAAVSRAAVARRMGVPLSYLRLLHVYRVWGFHSIFSSAAKKQHHSQAGFNRDAFAQDHDQHLLDPKDAASQTIRLFGVALRRGAGHLIVEHPAEYLQPLFAFLETVLADKPFAVIESTSYLLQIVADRFEELEKMLAAPARAGDDEDDAIAPAQRVLLQTERAGLARLAGDAAAWAQALLKLQGGGWDLATIAPTADALERLRVRPPSPFWWRCGCGARNPCASVRCTMCLRRDATAFSHWTCVGKGCGARQFIEWYRLGPRGGAGGGSGNSDGSRGGDHRGGGGCGGAEAPPMMTKSDHVKVKCVACQTQHPWLTELAKLRGKYVACSRCLEVQPLTGPAATASDASTTAPLFLDLCTNGTCVTFQKGKKSIGSIGNSDRARRGEKGGDDGATTDAAEEGKSTALAAAVEAPSPTKAAAAGGNARWQCPDCSTMTTSPIACPGCGLLKDATQSDTRLWVCDDCGSWNFAGVARCHRFEFCRGRKKSIQRPVPYVRWRCGCGQFNPMWRVGCSHCCGKPKQQHNHAEGGGQGRASSQLYTCPTCRTVPPRLVVRALSPPHPMRPGMKIVSCGHCAADHPRDAAVLGSVHFERPCVSCGDWHTLPGFSPTTAPSLTVCCAHCSCESAARAEPFSRWSCETCAFDAAKKARAKKLQEQEQQPPGGDAAPPEKDYCWRTGYRCDTCGDLHPALAFSVVRTGIAARSPNSVYDAVFLWKCTAQIPAAASLGEDEEQDAGPAESASAARGLCDTVCCGTFNPSWETHCKACNRTRFQPASSPSPTGTANAAASTLFAFNKGMPPARTAGLLSSASSTSSSSSNLMSGSAAGVEIRARYIPWSCDACQELQPPEAVVQCSSCFHPRVPPACLHCGQHHITLACPPSSSSSSAASTTTSSRAPESAAVQ